MNLLVAWKKVLLFGAFGAVGCLAGWLVGEPYLFVAGEVAARAGAKGAPSLISRPTSADPPPLTRDFLDRLKAVNPPPPPRDFLDRLKAAGAKSGDVQISLIWYDTNDLDLHCVDPDGFEIFWKPDHRRSRSGGELDVDRNAGCQDPIAEPVENIYWAKGTAPSGTYSVYLNFYQQCPRGPTESDYKINVLHGGERQEFKGTIRKDRTDTGPKRLIYKFQLEPKIEVFAPDTFQLAPGTSLRVPVAVRREFFQGKVEVRAERLPASVTAEPLVLQPNQSEGELVFKATDATIPGETRIKIVAAGEGVSYSVDPTLVVPRSQFSLWAVISTGVWTALLALGLCLALLAGQNRYLGKAPFASGRVPLALVVLGALAAGFVSGSVGQVLYFVFLAIGIAKLGFLVGWVLLGGLLGRGVSAFIPNLDGTKAALAGLGGGLLGAVAFWALSAAAEWIGRFGGAALLGFCIGLMVAVVEAAFRRAWLEVRFSEREIITVNLGPEPVKVGGDARASTVWARGAAAIALRYWIRDGKVYCEDVPAKREAAVTNGDTRTAGGVTVVVRTGGSPAPVRDRPPPGPAPQPPPIPGPPPAAPAPRATAALPGPVPARPAEPEYDDLPMPMGPPALTRPATPSILDLDDSPVATARPAVPAPAPKPVPPARSAPPPPKPPVPTAAKPVAPPAPKPPGPAPATAPKPGTPDSCPTCGRKAPDQSGERYCMVCDRTF
ncbi:hypothetical protein [Frigoriglobus tundricola]|uniref:Uncharacterized protein n=1 Tax=Frigoriglobus tundricola TaxID=2774151 RepID=A0A6M5YRU6_9BACT|nr:hypothetical protein [Frigoriglobus tundricola]QJW96775.1 hypothetical protein FTUN_4334 [Frigoriglobus tundricola]